MSDTLNELALHCRRLFLAQNPCITGTTVCVDNGQHLVPLARDVMFLADPKGAA